MAISPHTGAPARILVVDDEPIIIFSAIFGNELTAECGRLGLLTIDKVDWHALVDCCRAAVEQSAPRRRRQLASRKPALSQT